LSRDATHSTTQVEPSPTTSASDFDCSKESHTNSQRDLSQGGTGMVFDLQEYQKEMVATFSLLTQFALL
jgi:hypothetical protein